MKRKIFLSFSGLLDLFRRNQVTEADLVGSLFAFGCGRGNVFHAPIYERMDEYKGIIRALGTHAAVGCVTIVQRAIESAEEEGRAVWRAGKELTLDELNDLLAKHGYQPIANWDRGAAVPRMIQEANPDLEGIHWHRDG